MSELIMFPIICRKYRLQWSIIYANLRVIYCLKNLFFRKDYQNIHSIQPVFETFFPKWKLIIYMSFNPVYDYNTLGNSKPLNFGKFSQYFQEDSFLNRMTKRMYKNTLQTIKDVSRKETYWLTFWLEKKR